MVLGPGRALAQFQRIDHWQQGICQEAHGRINWASGQIGLPAFYQMTNRGTSAIGALAVAGRTTAGTCSMTGDSDGSRWRLACTGCGAGHGASS